MSCCVSEHKVQCRLIVVVWDMENTVLLKIKIIHYDVLHWKKVVHAIAVSCKIKMGMKMSRLQTLESYLEQ